VNGVRLPAIIQPRTPELRVGWMVLMGGSPSGRFRMRAYLLPDCASFKETGGKRPHQCSTASRRRPGLRDDYCSKVLVSVPMPSIVTSTTLLFSFITPTPTEVPQAMMSPGSSVMSREMSATSFTGGKYMSETG